MIAQTKPVDILLVDDDEDDKEIFEFALNEVAHPVRLVYKKNGAELMSYLQNGNSADLVFLDLNMPKVSGFESLKWIRNNTQTSKLPVIILSTSNSTKDIDKCHEFGANFYIIKPFNYKRLSIIINALVYKASTENINFPPRKNFLYNGNG